VINPFSEVINAIQKVNGQDSGIEYAPLQDSYPGHVDTMIVPCALTRIAPGSIIPLSSPAMPATLNLIVTIYVETWNQSDLSIILPQCNQIGAAWWQKFQADDTYLWGDSERKFLVEENGLQIYINATGTETFTGYVPRQYPLGSTNDYHAIEMTLSVDVQVGDC